jgi:ribosome-associated protein
LKGRSALGSWPWLQIAKYRKWKPFSRQPTADSPLSVSAIMSHSPTVRAFAIEAAQLLADRHCEDVRLMDVRGLSQVCDYVLIGSGTSDRQMKSVAAELEDLGKAHDNAAFRSNRDEGGTWIVVDFIDVVAHLFEPNQRAYYDLEALWSEAEIVDWQAKTRKRKGSRGDGRGRVARDSP